MSARHHGRPRPEPTPAITTARLHLTPLRIDDADEMVAVLADERLHDFVGGRPATADELRERYGRLTAGAGSRTNAGSTGSSAGAKTARRWARCRRR